MVLEIQIESKPLPGREKTRGDRKAGGRMGAGARRDERSVWTEARGGRSRRRNKEVKIVRRVAVNMILRCVCLYVITKLKRGAARAQDFLSKKSYGNKSFIFYFFSSSPKPLRLSVYS